jgi:hypothetical protein
MPLAYLFTLPSKNASRIRKLVGVLTAMLAMTSLWASTASAEIVSSSPRQFELRHTAQIRGSDVDAWARLVAIRLWWASAHTYSGDANNLRLAVQPGGCWCERWRGGSVEHARVLFVAPRKMLRLKAEFGPLQAMGVTGILTFQLEPAPVTGVTQIKVTYLVNGVPESKLDEIAPAIDRVLGEQVARLSTAN